MADEPRAQTRGRCPQRQPYAHLVRSLRDCIRNDSVDAHQRQQQPKARKEDQRRSIELRPGKSLIYPLLHRFHGVYWNPTINGLQNGPDRRYLISGLTFNLYDERRVKSSGVARRNESLWGIHIENIRDVLAQTGP